MDAVFLAVGQGSSRSSWGWLALFHRRGAAAGSSEPRLQALRPVQILLIAACLVAGACGTSSERGAVGTWTSESEERADTVIVRTLSGSVWGDTMSLVPELAIGELDGLPDLVFGRVGAIDLDSEGRLYVVDAQARQIRVFSSTGEHLRTFGGTGDGPGEFRSPGHLRATSDGRIVVRDNMGGGRFSVFTDEGAYLGGWPLASGYSTNAPFHLDQQQRVVNPTFPDRLVVYDLDGGAQDTIANPSRGYEPTRLEAVFASGRASYPVPFMPREVWTMTRDGRILFGLSNEYSVERWEDDGVSFRIERRAESVPVLRAEADRAREAVTSTIRSSNDPNWRWDGPDIPSVKPVFETIHPGLDGTIWVFRNGPSTEVPNPGWDPEQPQAAPRTWFSSPVVADVFEEDGQYLGPVRIPEVVAWGLPPAVLTREWIWASTMHPDGYPQVVRFRVAPG